METAHAMGLAINQWNRVVYAIVRIVTSAASSVPYCKITCIRLPRYPGLAANGPANLASSDAWELVAPSFFPTPCTMAPYDEQYQTLRATFASQRTKSIKWRKWQLKQLWWMMEENEQRWQDALTADLGRHPFESATFEIQAYKRDILRALENVEKWAAGNAPEGAGVIFGRIGQAWLRKEPLGVALIIGTVLRDC